ncbi:MAG: hypothetical protein A2Y65_02000 [Deltaproteobacteria bacterium RBG_13_52_11]|nr:MAG: hypothetical protein A2Y65_02000 [Deltaproteobacteria bacterium RBG_13_52_11]
MGTTKRREVVKWSRSIWIPDKADVNSLAFSRAVKQFAYDLGAEAVGIINLNRNWVWKRDGRNIVPEV